MQRSTAGHWEPLLPVITSSEQRGRMGRKELWKWTNTLKKLPDSEEFPTRGALSRHRTHIPFFFLQLLQLLCGSYTIPIPLTEFHGHNQMCNLVLYILHENKTGPVLMWMIWWHPYLPTFGLGPQSDPFVHSKEKSKDQEKVIADLLQKCQRYTVEWVTVK